MRLRIERAPDDRVAALVGRTWEIWDYDPPRKRRGLVAEYVCGYPTRREARSMVRMLKTNGRIDGARSGIRK